MNTKSFIKFADNLLGTNLVPGIQGNSFDYGSETMDPLTSLAVGGGMSGAIGGAALLNRMRNKKVSLPSKTTPKPRISPALRKAREELASQAAAHAAYVDESQKALNSLNKELDSLNNEKSRLEQLKNRYYDMYNVQRASHATYVDESQKALNSLNKELDAKAKLLETAENYPERLKKRYYAAYGKPNERLSGLLSKSSDKASKVLKGLFSKLRKVPYLGPASLALSSAGLGAAGMSMAKDDPTLTSAIAEQEPKVKDVLKEHPELLYYGLPALIGTGAGGLLGNRTGAILGGLGGLALPAIYKYLENNPDTLEKFTSLFGNKAQA